MNRRDFLKAAAALGGLAMTARADTAPKANLGLLLYSCGNRARIEKAEGFSEPLKFLEFASRHSANAVQLSLSIQTEQDATAIRRRSEQLNVAIEGIVSPPKATAQDIDRFTAELRTVRACGASLVRTVMLGGRRYEVFEKAEEYVAFAKGAEESLQRAEKIAGQEQVVLAVENHKDFRTDEMLDLLKRVSSEWVGVCLDTGNNLALLEDPQAVAEALVPWIRTVHLKDLGVEESANGFHMAEVPLGSGTLDLKRIVAAVRQANPKARFQLEMITRDPLSIPCLTEKYWQTMGRVPARELAQVLSRIRSAPKTPLPRITALPPDQQLAIEDDNIRQSFDHAAKVGLIA